MTSIYVTLLVASFCHPRQKPMLANGRQGLKMVVVWGNQILGIAAFGTNI